MTDIPEEHGKIIDKICEECGVSWRGGENRTFLAKKESQQILAFIQTLKKLAGRRATE